MTRSTAVFMVWRAADNDLKPSPGPLVTLDPVHLDVN